MVSVDPSYLPRLRQQRLKPTSGATRAQVIATELLGQLLVPVHHASAAPDAGFGRVALPALAGALKSSAGLRASRGGMPYSLQVRDRPPSSGRHKVLRGSRKGNIRCAMSRDGSEIPIASGRTRSCPGWRG